MANSIGLQVTTATRRGGGPTEPGECSTLLQHGIVRAGYTPAATDSFGTFAELRVRILCVVTLDATAASHRIASTAPVTIERVLAVGNSCSYVWHLLSSKESGMVDYSAYSFA